MRISSCIHIALPLVLAFITLSCHEKKDKPTVAPPVRVTVMEIGMADSHFSREYSGTVSSSETTTVSFSVGGTITGLYAKEGQKVAKGQLLAKVRNGEYLNAYNIASAELAEAQDAYQRLKKLHDANALPEVKWVEVEQKLKQAENAAEIAKRTLDDANLHSPVSGTVTRKFADDGQTVLTAEPIYEIVSTGDLTIDISVSQNEIGNFKVGEKAIVKLDAVEETLEGKVNQKSVVADPLTRSYAIKVAIPNKEGRVLPGMLGNVIFEDTMNGEDTMKEYSLPSQAVLLNDDNRWFVWVAVDSVAERRFVTAGDMTATGVVIKSGLSKGDKVIVEGMQKVGTGTKVIPLER